MTKSGLSSSDLFLSVHNILIDTEVWHNVVNGMSLTWLDVVPLVLKVLFSPVEVLARIRDTTHGLVSSKVRDEVVHGVHVGWLNFGLFTSSRRANGVTFQLNKTLVVVGLVLEWLWHDPLTVFILNWSPFLASSLLDMGNAGLSSNDITVKTEIRSPVVGDLFGVLAWVHIVPGVVSDFLGLVETVESLFDITVSTEIWDLVVHGERHFLWVFAAVTTSSGVADGIRLGLQTSFGLGLNEVIISVVREVVNGICNIVLFLFNIPGSVLLLGFS